MSLAIWMGGVTYELDRIRRHDGAYGELLELTRSVARIDVIPGASAGGIDGALLAMAIARGTTVDVIRTCGSRRARSTSSCAIRSSPTRRLS